MTRLLAVELSRFRSRRTVALLALAAILVSALLVGATAWTTRPLTEADRTDATAQAELEGQRPEIRQQVRACRSDPTSYLGPTATAEQCAEALVPGPEAYYPREELSLRSTLSPSGLGVTLALVVVALMIIAGSAFIGADWRSGSLTNQLIFEPRRLRVWLGKAAAVLIGSGLITLVVLSGFWLTVGALAQAREVAISSAEVADVSWHVARAVALSMAAALGAFALTAAFRHTVATLALLFIYAVGGEVLVNLLPVSGAGRWSVGNNALGWLARHHEYFDNSIVCGAGAACDSTQVLTHLEAGTFLGVLLVIAVVVSLVWFKRSDV